MDNFFRNIFRRREREALSCAPQLSSQPQPQQDAQAGVDGAEFESRVARVGSESAALRLSAVYRAAELRINAMSQLLLSYQTYDRGSKCYSQANFGQYGLLNYLLQVRPNYYTNAKNFWGDVERRRLFYGNAIIYVVRDDLGYVAELHLANSWAYDQAGDTYFITYSPKNISVSDVPSTEVLHIRNTYTEYNGLVGISTLHAAAKSLGIAATNEAQAEEVAAKGGRLKMLIKQKQMDNGFGIVAGTEMDKVATRLEGSVLNKDVIAVPDLVDATMISQTSEQMQLLSSREFDTEVIGRFFAVPISLLNVTKNATYKTAEAATLELFRTLAPSIYEIECECNSKLLCSADFGKRRFAMIESPLYRLDLTTRAAWCKARLETGLASVNELRAEQDLPAVEHGDDHYISCNVAPVGSAKISGEEKNTNEQ